MPSDVVPTAWCYQLTNYTSYRIVAAVADCQLLLLLLLPTPPEVATVKMSAGPVTQRRQSASRKDERIHCQSMRAVDLP